MESVCLRYEGSFNELHKVSSGKLFGAADLVMVPDFFSDAGLQFSVPPIYGPYLESHFHLVSRIRAMEAISALGRSMKVAVTGRARWGQGCKQRWHTPENPIYTIERPHG